MKTTLKTQRSRIIIILVSILILGFLVNGFLNYQVTRRYVKNSAIYQTLPLISDNIYSMIKTDLMDPIKTSSLMANDTFLINWVTSGEQNVDEISQYLARIKEKYGYTSSFFVSERTSNYYTANGILKQISLSDSHDIWYYLFKDLNRSYDLDIDNDQAANDTMTIFINHRLETSDGTFLGVTGVGLEVSDIGKRFRDYQERFEHEIYLVNDEGLIQIHPNEDMIEQVSIYDIEGLSDLGETILTAGNTTRIFEYQGANGIKDLSVRYIPDFNWYLIVEKNQNASLQNARNNLIINIFIGIAVAVITIGLIILLTQTYNTQLEHLATHDTLTKLHNRRAFNDILEQQLAFAKRYNQPISLLFIDVDDFKSINDRFGHLKGDAVLSNAAARIMDEMRQSDIVGRWGGEEFVALLPNTDKPQAQEAAIRIKEAFESTPLITSEHLSVCTVSIGISTFSESSGYSGDLIHLADRALYTSKSKGKNQISIMP